MEQLPTPILLLMTLMPTAPLEFVQQRKELAVLEVLLSNLLFFCENGMYLALC